MDFLSCVLRFSVAVLPEKAPGIGTLPEVARSGASPAGGFLFGRSFCFQGAVPNVRKSSLSEKNANP